jgi:hypothetical protein
MGKHRILHAVAQCLRTQNVHEKRAMRLFGGVQAPQQPSSSKIARGRGKRPYIYNTGYLFKTGGTNWTQIPYTSTEALVAGAWYPKNATTNISLTSTELAQPLNVLGYICSWTGSAWKCGCRDSACTQSYWMIQSFKR